VPLIAIFQQAFVEGAAHYFNSPVGRPIRLHAIGLTLVVAALTSNLNQSGIPAYVAVVSDPL